MVRWLLALGVIAAAGAYAYRTGARLAAADVDALQTRIDDLTRQISELETAKKAQTLELDSARGSAEEWKQRYQVEVPAGPPKELFDLIQAKLAQGLSIDRVRYVLQNTENKQDCDSRPEVKRLLIRTPLDRDRERWTTFAGGSLTVLLSGVSARSAAGDPEAWFDSTQPVTIRLNRSGRVTEASGVLPQTTSLIDSGQEYRLKIAPAARGFAQVTLQRCRFP